MPIPEETVKTLPKAVKAPRKLTWQHFHPHSIWTLDEKGPKFSNGNPEYIVDSRTKDKYLNEDWPIIWFKCFMLTIGTPVVHAIAATLSIISNLLKLAFFYDFWKPLEKNKEENAPGYDIKQRSTDAGSRLLHILFAPVAVLLLECAAFYGLIMPRDGRKLYANLEFLMYGHFILAPCFQPEPEAHFFGGDVKTQNAC